MTKEDRVQHDFIMWFSQTRPECEGIIFEVYNNAVSGQAGRYRKSMGRKAGVADLCGLTPLGEFLGIEIKAPKSNHEVIQLETELRWGRKVIENGGLYLITEDIENMKYFIEKLWNNESEKAIELMHRCIEDVERRIRETKFKSITF